MNLLPDGARRNQSKETRMGYCECPGGFGVQCASCGAIRKPTHRFQPEACSVDWAAALSQSELGTEHHLPAPGQVVLSYWDGKSAAHIRTNTFVLGFPVASMTETPPRTWWLKAAETYPPPAVDARSCCDVCSQLGSGYAFLAGVAQNTCVLASVSYQEVRGVHLSHYRWW